MNLILILCIKTATNLLYIAKNAYSQAYFDGIVPFSSVRYALLHLGRQFNYSYKSKNS